MTEQSNSEPHRESRELLIGEIQDVLWEPGQPQDMWRERAEEIAERVLPKPSQGADVLRRAIVEHRTAITNAGTVRVDARDSAAAEAKHRADPMSQSDSDPVVLYRVDVVDRRTMTSRGVSVLARNDLEAFEAIRDEYPQRQFDVIDRATGELVELDGRA